jgi:hypothetical protein
VLGTWPANVQSGRQALLPCIATHSHTRTHTHKHTPHTWSSQKFKKRKKHFWQKFGADFWISLKDKRRRIKWAWLCWWGFYLWRRWAESWCGRGVDVSSRNRCNYPAGHFDNQKKWIEKYKNLEFYFCGQFCLNLFRFSFLFYFYFPPTHFINRLSPSFTRDGQTKETCAAAHRAVAMQNSRTTRINKNPNFFSYLLF